MEALGDILAAENASVLRVEADKAQVALEAAQDGLPRLEQAARAVRVH